MDGMADEALLSRNMAMISDRKLPIPKQRKNIFNFECQKTWNWQLPLKNDGWETILTFLK